MSMEEDFLKLLREATAEDIDLLKEAAESGDHKAVVLKLSATIVTLRQQRDELTEALEKAHPAHPPGAIPCTWCAMLKRVEKVS